MCDDSQGRSFFADADAICAELGLPSEFPRSLYAGDDWTFIIRAHALLESALTHAIGSALVRPELVPALSRLGLQYKRRLALSLDIIDGYEDHFIGCIASMRNHVVHDIRQVSFQIANHVSQWTARQLRDLTPHNSSEDHDDPNYDKENARFVLWLGLIYLLGVLYLRKEAQGLAHKMRLRPPNE